MTRKSERMRTPRSEAWQRAAIDCASRLPSATAVKSSSSTAALSAAERWYEVAASKKCSGDGDWVCADMWVVASCCLNLLNGAASYPREPESSTDGTAKRVLTAETRRHGFEDIKPQAVSSCLCG